VDLTVLDGFDDLAMMSAVNPARVERLTLRKSAAAHRDSVMVEVLTFEMTKGD
jgi:hypothetical protein